MANVFKPARCIICKKEVLTVEQLSPLGRSGRLLCDKCFGFGAEWPKRIRAVTTIVAAVTEEEEISLSHLPLAAMTATESEKRRRNRRGHSKTSLPSSVITVTTEAPPATTVAVAISDNGGQSSLPPQVEESYQYLFDLGIKEKGRCVLPEDPTANLDSRFGRGLLRLAELKHYGLIRELGDDEWELKKL